MILQRGLFPPVMSEAQQDPVNHEVVTNNKGANDKGNSNANKDSTTQASNFMNSSTSGGDQATDPEDGVARLTVSIPKGLYRRFRLHALDNDITLSALLAQMIRKELS